jgi:hypothetical protein
VIQGFLLDRVDAKSGRTAVSSQHHLVAGPLAHKARSALAFVQAAVAWTQVALDAAVVDFVPPTGRVVSVAHVY